MIFEVVVGNIGTVYTGHNRKQAIASYNTYVEKSVLNESRCGGESVYLLTNGEIEREHIASVESDSNNY